MRHHAESAIVTHVPPCYPFHATPLSPLAVGHTLLVSLGCGPVVPSVLELCHLSQSCGFQGDLCLVSAIFNGVLLTQ